MRYIITVQYARTVIGIFVLVVTDKARGVSTGLALGLAAGINGKDSARQTLPFLNLINSWPADIFRRRAFQVVLKDGKL